MAKGQRAGDAPIGIDVVEGKSYFWCSCGKSSKQPFCDGSHKGTEFTPLAYKADQSKKVFFCTCKKTNDPPMCDGSHNIKQFMSTKAIIFDAYGTLFDVNSAAEKCKDKIGNQWEGFANFWRTTQLEYTWLRSLMRKHKDFWSVTEESLDKSMKVFKIDSAMKYELLNLYKILSPYPEVKEVLNNLKKKNYKLSILSNGTPALLNELVKSNDLENIFDDLFSIEEVGIYKPDSKVYDMPIKKYQIKSEEVAFLSANTWDVSGGGNYGYNSIWVNRNKAIFDNLDYKPKNEITNLTQLLDIIQLQLILIK